MTHMNVKLILEEWLKEHKFDGLCNLDVPCGCLCGDLAPCGEMNEDCRPGHRADVEEQDVCGCDGQGTKHWHVCIEGPVAAMRKAFDEAPEWLCDCGQRCVPTAGDWRWNGRDWEHHHGYPIGHVTAKRSPNAPPTETTEQLRFSCIRKECRWRISGLAANECNHSENGGQHVAYRKHNGRDCRHEWCPLVAKVALPVKGPQ
jgi:hypothetical protein